MASEMVGQRAVGKNYWGMAECDSCKGSPALLFCRADSAFLCGPCDVNVHGANRLASRHERVRICEVLERPPAAFTCKADAAAALCVACDSDTHSANPLPRRHDRFPVVPFFDSPADATSGALKSAINGPGLLLDPSDDGGGVTEKLEVEYSWLFPNPNPTARNKVVMEAPELKAWDFFFSDVDTYLDREYPLSMDASSYDQTDSVVPVQAKTAGTTPHPPPFVGPDGCIDFNFARSKPSYVDYTTAPSHSHSISSSEVVPEGNSMADTTNPFGGRGWSARMAGGTDREAKVMRYREKKKNRKFEKTIRYESRKAYAETRPRMKGRFAKRPEIDAEVDRIHSSAAALTVDPWYGAVPSF